MEGHSRGPLKDSVLAEMGTVIVARALDYLYVTVSSLESAVNEVSCRGESHRLPVATKTDES